MGREGNRLKTRSFILAGLVIAANSAHACNENCRAIFMNPLTRETTEGTDERCLMRKEACNSCARDKAHEAGVTLECANCVIDSIFPSPPADLQKCIPLCGSAAKVKTTSSAVDCCQGITKNAQGAVVKCAEPAGSRNGGQ
jgi:hypothetical protein